jgi:Holliday junction resolvasome RuvABC endonuclease subunit
MIRVILSLHELPPSDAADALALAVTHLQNTIIAPPLGRASPRRRRGG